MCDVSKCPQKSAPLDKLAQGGTNGISQQKKYAKKARAKALTNAVVCEMLSANTKPQIVINDDGSSYIKPGYRSANTNAYLRTFECCRYIYQDGHKVKSEYCKNRWCITCNRIRIANLIHGYLPALGEMEDKQFVTLTIPNVKGVDLPGTIDGMGKAFTKVKGQLKKAHQRGQLPKFNGLRKLECTYNVKKDTYHPHFHLIVEGREMANELYARWLREFPEASYKAQDIRKADDGSAKELFKYFGKLFNDGQIHGKALDTIFCAIKGKQIFKPFGSVRKVSEDIPELISDTVTFKGERIEVWKWMDDVYDWIAPDGETFSDYVPSDQVREIVENAPKILQTYDQVRELIENAPKIVHKRIQESNIKVEAKTQPTYGKRKSPGEKGSNRNAEKYLAKSDERTHARNKVAYAQNKGDSSGMGNNLECGKQPPDTT